jgi:hypothetical protein
MDIDRILRQNPALEKTGRHMPRLVVHPGSPTAWEIQLKPGVNFIGRGFANDVKIPDGSVSGSHCQITVADNGAVVKDLGSTNGTFVNRAPVREAPLASGQSLRLGGVEMMFYSDAPAPQTASAPAALVSAPAAIAIAHPAPSPISEATIIPPEATTVVMAAPPPPAPRIARPVAAPGRIQPQPAAKAAAPPGKKPSFGMGLLGGLAGALVGSLVYFLAFKYALHVSLLYLSILRFLAVGVGFLAGMGAEWLGRKEGSKELGMIAVVFTLAGIVGAQYLVARGWWNEGSAARAYESSYETQVAEAKKVIAAVPTGSDQEIRNYLAKEAADEDEKPDPKAVTAEEIKEFRDKQLPELRDMASGKITKEEFDKKNQVDPEEQKKELAAEEGTFKAVFLLLLLSKFNLVSCAIASGLAYKLCANA